jgi:hypothetical protein
VPKAASSDPSLKEISERLARIEAALAELTALVRGQK